MIRNTQEKAKTGAANRQMDGHDRSAAAAELLSLMSRPFRTAAAAKNHLANWCSNLKKGTQTHTNTHCRRPPLFSAKPAFQRTVSA